MLPKFYVFAEIPTQLRGKFYRATMFYGSECLTINKQYIYKMIVTYIRISIWMSGYMLSDRVRNVHP